MQWILATNNPGKLREFRVLLAGLPVTVQTPAELGLTYDPEETGTTFSENAILKAVGAAHLTGKWALGDDSGLEVEALGGAPGIYSHRFAGPHDADRIQKLLHELHGVPAEKRQARFVCVIALASPHGETILVQGECRGQIISQPRGSNGFGYDPIFFIPELGMTMAELDEEIKNMISHRARAAQQARRCIERLAVDQAQGSPQRLP